MVVGTLKPSIKCPCPPTPSLSSPFPLASKEVVGTLKPSMVPTTSVGARGQRGERREVEQGCKGERGE